MCWWFLEEEGEGNSGEAAENNEKPTVELTEGAGIEEDSLDLGMDSNDVGGTIIGSITGITGITVVTLFFAETYTHRPSSIIVTNALLGLQDLGNYHVLSWDHEKFSIRHEIKNSIPEPTGKIPLYYYSVTI